MKKLLVKPGDIFAVPVELDENRPGYVLGRVISEENVNAHLAEFFEPLYESLPEVVQPSMLQRRLFRPIFVKFLFTQIPKWSIVARNPNFDKTEAGYQNIQIAFDKSLPPKLWMMGHTKVVSPEEIIGLEPSIVWFPEKLIKRIVAHLKGQYGPEDVFPV